MAHTLEAFATAYPDFVVWGPLWMPNDRHRDRIQHLVREYAPGIVSKYYKIDPDMLKSKSRKKIYAHPRNIYTYLCRKHTHEPLEKIAQTINRSHSTVVYASELVEKKMKADDKMKHQVNFLSKKIDEMKK